MHDHLGSAFRDLTEPGDVVGGAEAACAAVGDLREMQRDGVVGQGEGSLSSRDIGSSNGRTG